MPTLDSGRADLTIFPAMEGYPPELESETIYSDEIVCYRHPSQAGGPLSLECYVALPHATLDFGGDRMSIIDMALRAMNIERRVILSAANSAVLADLMTDTPLVATLPRFLGETSFQGFRVDPLPFVVAPLKYDMVWHRRNSHAGRHLWLSEIVRSAFEM